MGHRGRERGGQYSEEWDTEEGNGWTALRGMTYRGREWDREHSEEWNTEEGNGVNSTQRNGIKRKETGWTALKGMGTEKGLTALRGMGYKGRERNGQHLEEWDKEEGNGVDSTQRNGYRERVDSTQRNGIQRKDRSGMDST